MSWVASAVNPASVNGEFVYDLCRRHRLVPEPADAAIEYFQAVSERSVVVAVNDAESGKRVADIIISDIVDGHSAQVDMIPDPKFFAPILPDGSKNEDPYLEKIAAALDPVFTKLIAGRKLRRLTSFVPKSRSRTFKALQACGFKKEGVMRRAVQFQGREAEDLVVMGHLGSKE